MATQVKLVQSGRFPNLWSIVGVEDKSRIGHTWRDPMFRNGAMSAENAVKWAREQGFEIIEIESIHWGDYGDNTRDVIAGIEYRSRRPVLDRFEYEDSHGKRCHVIEVYSSGVASILWEETRWTDEIPLDQLIPIEAS